MWNKEINDEELLEVTQHTIDLVVLDNQKYTEKVIREYLSSCGIKVGKGKEGLTKAKQFLDDIGMELEIKATNLNIEEEEIGWVKANQILRLKLKPKLS